MRVPLNLSTLHLITFFGNRIVPVPAPGVAAPDSLESQPDTLQWPPFLDRLDHVMRARWLIPATRGQQRRNRQLIEPHRQNEYLLKQLF